MSTSNTTAPSRRNLLAGAGAVGAAAVAATALPLAKQAATPIATAPATAAEQGGYQVTAHVLRYYQTARV
jgi:hypothetical protein